MSARPILIMAGGTGGHVFPALAVARVLRAQGIAVTWLGTRQGLEARVVPEAGFPMAWIRVSGLRGKGLVRRLSAPFMLALALLQSFWVLVRLRPAAVLGMGGFVTGPGGLMAWLLRRPLLIHEQNSVAGMTNRWLAPLARQVMVAFPAALPGALLTGNPVREDIAALPAPGERLVQRTGAPRLLVLGGSLGAQALNETVPAAIARLPEDLRPEVWHQTGIRHLDAGRAAYAAAGISARVEPFVDDMAAAYGWADLVVCRAGALTVAELAAAGIGAILVPYPHAVDDHQTGNARYLAEQGAALLLPQPQLNAARLAELLQPLLADRARLVAMAGQARALAQPEAARRVAQACVAAAGLEWRAAA
ncbi:MAG: undecaprenyldiphospho-muramoylpentapeptide beta-N-acetylglucosaminyltransferase [Gammaproteobacteria bacterium]|nr:undecaprenyldiphospho-muramoylpentapeptide beta-N-acetylglucosaminyltransferase [Gammaproteobacteria bacterium]